MHYIQSYILDKLASAEILRNRDMRPPKVESNLYQYHLLQLQKMKYVKKTANGYTLDDNGMAYADHFSNALKKQRLQPKIVTILFVINEKNQLLLRHKQRQPFIGMYGLTAGKVHKNEDIQTAALREFNEKVSIDYKPEHFEYFGTSHFTINRSECTVSEFIGLMMAVEVKSDVSINKESRFYDNNEINKLDLMPSVKELIEAYKDKKIFVEGTIEI